MHPDHKKILRAVSLELRHTREGLYDDQGRFQPGDLEHRDRLNLKGYLTDLKFKRYERQADEQWL